METGLTVKLEFVRRGKPLRLRLTLPVNPPDGVTAIVSLAVEFTATAIVPEAAPSEKFPDEPEDFTTSVTIVVWVTPPLVPLTVKEYVPAGVELLVVTSIVDEPVAVNDDGLKLALAPEGSPEALKSTVPLNPDEKETLMV